jgi:hypothetical protein
MIRKIRLIISSSSVIMESKFLALVTCIHMSMCTQLHTHLHSPSQLPPLPTHTHTYPPMGLTQDSLWKWTTCLAIFAKPLKIYLQINTFTIPWKWNCVLKRHEYISSVLPLTQSFHRLELWLLGMNFQWHATSRKQMNVIGLKKEATCSSKSRWIYAILYTITSQNTGIAQKIIIIIK